MPTTPIDSSSDTELLREFVDSRSPQAFAALVERYLPLIYSSAFRQTRDPHLAEDIAQATLIIFSQRAARIDPPILVGWLLKTTHFVARNALRQQSRRARYEQRAAAMKSETQPPTESTDADAISKVIDPALAMLRDADRTAVVLRYFQNKSFADIAARMNTTEAAVQRRVSRAVQKLRQILSCQGIRIAPATLPVLLSAQTCHPVPPSLALHAATLSSLNTTAISFLVEGAFKTMAATKLKITFATIVAILLIGALVPEVYYYVDEETGAIQVNPPLAAATLPSWLPKGTDLTVPVSGSLPPGMTAQPLAIMRLSDKRWMTPTGEPYSEAGLLGHLDKEMENVHSPSASYVLLYRISYPSLDSAKMLTASFLEGTIPSNSITWDDPDPTQQYQITCFDPQPGLNSVSLGVDVATGPWTTAATISALSTTPVQASMLGSTVTLYPPTQEKDGVQIKCREPELDNATTRFYAIDSSGKKVDYQRASENGHVFTYRFDGKLSDLNEFHLDVRVIDYHATYAPVPLPR